ncbi:hypothetical protein K505DRAFT_227175 [Melanomma pulvis-pyrius CBS 109.77]|uniref:Tautomerase cis-CaaD-like domain-containing protein n=1 Tax=Melanomma pulvis-pyrius CBS 109.77 TaxID=1314802 RepID=A0A6A6XZN9_9PLEO|nr:hypothetical protein K505DRAFT_227175 [Melanomma pulvis-pyrius CBS 109.77]
MPLWVIYHPPNTFTTEETRAALAKEIVAIYTAASLPAFYVNTLFVPVQPTSYFIGGVSRPSAPAPDAGPGPDAAKPWIRITIQNIARKIPNKATADRFLERVDEALRPFIADKGYEWEYSVEETSRDLWKINGLVPPMPGSEAEKVWARENRSSVFDKAQGGLL